MDNMVKYCGLELTPAQWLIVQQNLHDEDVQHGIRREEAGIKHETSRAWQAQKAANIVKGVRYCRG